MKPNLLLKGKDGGDCAYSFRVFPQRPRGQGRPAWPAQLLSECPSVSADAIPFPPSSSRTPSLFSVDFGISNGHPNKWCKKE